jgi:hypothetical protein
MRGGLEHRADLAQRCGQRTVGLPPIVALPEVGVSRASSERSVVVLPEPFGPRKPVMVPASTPKLRSSTARIAP